MTSNESFLQWDAAQVSNFVSTGLPEGLKHLGSLFLEHNIEGSLLPFLTSEHLKEVGIPDLRSRLLVKKMISDKIESHYQEHPPQSLNDPNYKLNNININNNYVSIESLALSSVLLKGMVNKLNMITQEQVRAAVLDLSILVGSSEVKRLNENFYKLKTDLIPVIRLLKDLKPLPTPTLDPGHGLSSPTQLSLGSSSNTLDNALEYTDASTIQNTKISRRNSLSSARDSALVSPTHSNRFSSGSLLSLGTGKIIQQSVSKPVMIKSQSQNDVPRDMPNSNSSRSLNKPRIIETNSTAAPASNMHVKPQLRATSSLGSTNSHASSSSSGNEPLRQLRASTDDSCLKILQQAMKRHHIPRDDWSKYVLVICYDDKERILKLDEKPVIIFKELQERGRHPAIMLRQLAEQTDNDEPELYQNSRIGNDIPGGTL